MSTSNRPAKTSSPSRGRTRYREPRPGQQTQQSPQQQGGWVPSEQETPALTSTTTTTEPSKSFLPQGSTTNNTSVMPTNTTFTNDNTAILSDQISRVETNLTHINIAHQRDIITFQDQASATAKDVSEMQTVLHSDFNRVHHELQAMRQGMEELGRRNAVLEAGRGYETHLARAKALAEAECQELFARRIRESLGEFDATLRLTQGVQPLQLLAACEQQESAEDADDEGGDDDGVDIESSLEGAAATRVSSDQAASNDEGVAIGLGEEAHAHQSDDGDSTQEPPAQVPSTQGPSTQDTRPWLPLAIRHIPEITFSATIDNTTTFTEEELHRLLGGDQYSPGLYFCPNPPSARILPGKCYWLLDGHFEPYAPAKPGQHGAKLTAFFNTEANADSDMPDPDKGDDKNVPVFVALGSENQSSSASSNNGDPAPRKLYTYIGQYSQTRFSDNLSHSEIFDRVPAHVLTYWTKQLASPSRPQWLTDDLIDRFWPAPKYDGPIPTTLASTTGETGESNNSNGQQAAVERRVVRALDRHFDELVEWKKDVQLRASFFDEDAIGKMWDNADFDDEKGLRLVWEYLTCIGWDEGVYEGLCEGKKRGEEEVRSAAAAPSTAHNAPSTMHNSPGLSQHPPSPPSPPRTFKKGKKYSITMLSTIVDDDNDDIYKATSGWALGEPKWGKGEAWKEEGSI